MEKNEYGDPLSCREKANQCKQFSRKKQYISFWSAAYRSLSRKNRCGIADESRFRNQLRQVYAASDFLTRLACHAYAYANDARASRENYRAGNFRGNPEPIKRIVEWLKRHATASDWKNINFK